MHIVRKQTSKISTPDKKAKLQRLENDNKINWKRNPHFIRNACDNFIIIFKYVSTPTTAYAYG